VPVVDHAEIWPVVRRALRRPGEWELVGVVVGDDGARRGRSWLQRSVPEVLGGAWQVRETGLGPGLTALALRHDAPPARRRRPRRRRPARLRRAPAPGEVTQGASAAR